VPAADLIAVVMKYMRHKAAQMDRHRMVFSLEIYSRASFWTDSQYLVRRFAPGLWHSCVKVFSPNLPMIQQYFPAGWSNVLASDFGWYAIGAGICVAVRAQNTNGSLAPERELFQGELYAPLI